MRSRSQSEITPDEYLALERQVETKNEYFDGEIYAMRDPDIWHATIAVNLAASLVTQFRERACSALMSKMRVKVDVTGLYTYPDVVVFCGKAQLEDAEQDTLLNPAMIFEVFSPITESYDRGAKFAHYQTLESLTDYVLISQHEARVEHFVRQSGGKWLLSVHKGLDAVAELLSIGCELALAEVYDKVEFPEAGSVPLRIIRERLSDYEIEEDAYAHPSYPQNDP